MIGMMEFTVKEAELTSLGVRSTEDACLARVNKDGFPLLQSFYMKNQGYGNVTVTLKKRGQEYTIAAENIDALRVGTTDRFRGPFAQRRVKPGSITILDANVGVDQKIQDTNSDGILWQTDGPPGPAYPIKVGTVDYNNGIIDLTFNQAVTLSVVVAYKHTNWVAFDSPITFGMVAGAGARDYIILPDNAQNYVESLRDEIEFGWFGKKTASDQPSTSLMLTVRYFGDDSKIRLPLEKGEITGSPYHNN